MSPVIFRSKRGGLETFSSYSGMGEDTAKNLMEEIGHSDIRRVDEQEFIDFEKIRQPDPAVVREKQRRESLKNIVNDESVAMEVRFNALVDLAGFRKDV